VRNENYFQEGLPYLDKVVIKSSDPNTRFSACGPGSQMMFTFPRRWFHAPEDPGITYLKSKPVPTVCLS